MNLIILVLLVVAPVAQCIIETLYVYLETIGLARNPDGCDDLKSLNPESWSSGKLSGCRFVRQEGSVDVFSFQTDIAWEVGESNLSPAYTLWKVNRDVGADSRGCRTFVGPISEPLVSVFPAAGPVDGLTCEQVVEKLKGLRIPIEGCTVVAEEVVELAGYRLHNLDLGFTQPMGMGPKMRVQLGLNQGKASCEYHV
ncbi:hypothetical protein CRM22_010687 [Opisthorchis felineus]|uniref:Uncharacterized protein n=1 Tax=Opisthorchis felineus TaxID=147828 RepID=A0A4S2KQN1_OPIFE|nr:hypothetical protein CRM22_010687 [Opisthorchis felineus]